MPPKVAIIGAGIAGISAAIELSQSGFSVILIEAKNSIGGRVYSIKDNVTDEIIDNGQHALVGAYTHFLSILEILGTKKFLKYQDSLNVNFVDQKGNISELNSGQLKNKLGVLLGFLKFQSLSKNSKYHLIKFLIKIQLGDTNFTNKTTLDWLADNKQTQESIIHFWSPLIYATLNQSPEVASASLLHEVMKRTFFAGSESSRLILPTKDLSCLLEPFVNWIEKRNGKFIFSNPVINMCVHDSKISFVELKNGEKIHADYFIVTTQPATTFSILPQELKNQKYFSNLQKFKNSTIINIYYWFDKTLHSNDFYAMIGTKSQWMFNRRNFIDVSDAQKTKYPGHINITISAANEYDEIPSSHLAEECFNELKNSFNELNDVSLLHTKVIRDKRATFLADTATERVRPQNSTPISNLFFAGDWTNTGLPATIEGASVSGYQAAKEITEKQH